MERLPGLEGYGNTYFADCLVFNLFLRRDIRSLYFECVYLVTKLRPKVLLEKVALSVQPGRWLFSNAKYRCQVSGVRKASR